MSSKRARNQPWELDRDTLHQGMISRAERSTELQAQLAFAAVPSLLDHYFKKCEAVFAVAARPLQPRQRTEFRALLSQALATGFELSAHAKVVVQFTSDPAPKVGLSYQIGVQTKDVADVYATWLGAAEPPYFGAHPDAKLMRVASELEPGSRVLDIGARERLAPRGVLLCNLFLARSGYMPEPLARELSASVLSPIFTSADLERALMGLPLTLLSNESCTDYEREHLPPGAWPPTTWFEAWANGNNLFEISGQPPCEMRWLVFAKG